MLISWMDGHEHDLLTHVPKIERPVLEKGKKRSSLFKNLNGPGLPHRGSPSSPSTN